MKKPEEMTHEELGQAIDEDAMKIGLVIADIFKTVSMAACHLPNMELHTETICLSVDDEGISVHIGSPRGRSHSYDCHEGQGEDFGADSDDLEERIYDEF